MKTKITLLLKWLWFNTKFFLSVFFLVWILIYLFPNAMLSVFGQWAFLMKMLGAKNISEFVSQSDMFTHILIRNGMALIIYFIIGLFLQSPIALAFTGAFYSFIVFLAPLTMGKSFGLNDWLLISVELFALILSTSIASALAGELYDVKPDVNSLLKYWKFSWTRLWVKPVINWKFKLKEWVSITLLTILIIVGLSVFVAWFETYGY
ncbi:MAG: hypothetical protein ACM3XO_03610 [Bacteroidota bacterium]